MIVDNGGIQNQVIIKNYADRTTGISSEDENINNYTIDDFDKIKDEEKEPKSDFIEGTKLNDTIYEMDYDEIPNCKLVYHVLKKESTYDSEKETLKLRSYFVS